MKKVGAIITKFLMFFKRKEKICHATDLLKEYYCPKRINCSDCEKYY